MSATKRGATRSPNDFYATPESAFLPLIPYIKMIRPIDVWEPASGDGRLIRWMNEAGLKASGDDLSNGYDYLKDDTIRDCVVTNPPYSIAQEFCDHAIRRADYVFMLLRLNFLGAQYRRDWWHHHEPDALFVLSERPKFCKNKLGKLGSDATDYCWMFWGESKLKGIYHL